MFNVDCHLTRLSGDKQYGGVTNAADPTPTIPATQAPAEELAALESLRWARHDLRQGRREELPEWLVKVTGEEPAS